MTALFSTHQQSKATQNLVEFRAGKMQLEGTTVSADPRKGTFCMKFNSDNVLRLTWTDRTSNKVEDDLMILPDEVEFVRVPECKTGRVFLLRWKGHPRRLFFWMQEPDASKDESLFKRVSELVKKPEPTVSTASRDGNFPGSILEKIANLPGAPQEIYDFFRSMNQQQQQDSPRSPSREQSASPAIAASREAAPSSGRSGSGFMQFDDMIESYRQVLRQALRQASSSQPSRRDDTAAAEKPSTEEQKTIRQPDLARALSWKNIKPCFDQHPEALEALKEKLPEGRPKTAEEVIESLQCPQFAQTKRILGYVIASRQFKPIADQFGISSSEIADALQKGDLMAFCRALEALLAEEKGGAQEDSAMDELD